MVRVLGIRKATLGNWIRTSEKGEMRGAGEWPVCAEQMALARPRAELARVKMARDILKKSDGVLRASALGHVSPVTFEESRHAGQPRKAG